MAAVEDTAREIVQRYTDEGYNAGNTDVLRETVAEDVVIHGLTGVDGPLRGREAYLEWGVQMLEAIPDAHIETEALIAQDDVVAARWILTGTQEGPFGELPATGKPVEYDALALFRVEDGQIAEKWYRADELGLMQQLGALDSPVSQPTAREPERATPEEPERTAGSAAGPPLPKGVLEALEGRFGGAIVLPGDDGYEEARTIWNAMIDRRPAAIAQCRGVADVIAAVDVAHEYDLPLAVKAGGHNVAGNAVCDGGLVVDLSPMKSVRVDPEAKVARVEPGVTMGEFDRETQAFGLAAPGGVISTTGVAGLTLGGGWGWLSRSHGLAIDNLRSADVVTAEGEFVRASEDENEELFWALRGGGGNFGIVTSFEFQLHEVGPELLAGMLVYPFEDAASLLRFHREFTAEAPDELCCYAGILTAPPEPFLPEEIHGETIVVFAPCYAGDIEDGERAIEPLREVGEPIADLVQPQPYTAFQQMLDDAYGPGLRNYWKSQFVDAAGLSDEAIDIAVAYAETMASPHTAIMVEHLGGAIAERDGDATAYPSREAGYAFNIFPRWADPAEDDEHIAWAREFFDDVAPHLADGVYVNFLSQEGQERVKAAYGENYDRLVEIKNEWDPENRFRMNQNIEPTA